ncbi:MAG: hypothetical protein AAGA62_03580, partial [Bacteroidota bacterium]
MNKQKTFRKKTGVNSIMEVMMMRKMENETCEEDMSEDDRREQEVVEGGREVGQEEQCVERVEDGNNSNENEREYEGTTCHVVDE